MNLNIVSLTKRSNNYFNLKTRGNMSNILTIESRSCSRTRQSKFLKPKYTLKEDNIPRRQENSLSSERINSLMQDLGKAEQYLKDTKTYSKFRIIKEKIEPIESLETNESQLPSLASVLLSKKYTTKQTRTPVKIPRSGLNIQCLYKYGLWVI